jgi:hypothetical protein
MIDYSIFFRRPVCVDRMSRELPRFDIFVSAFDSSKRVRQVFSEIRALQKIWLIHPEYCYSDVEEPTGFPKVKPSRRDEVTQVGELLAEMGNLYGKTICIDITGMMRHVLMFLVAKLAHMGVKEFTALYSEPDAYMKQEETTFSTTTSGLPRPIRGMGGSSHSAGRDHLIIAVGYDHKLINEVANHKDSSAVYPVFGFPSLSADMYQQSAVRASQSGDIALERDWVSNRKFAPANDPFSTANVVSEIVREIDRKGGAANVYLSPLSTKAQALGFAVYWQLEGRFRDPTIMLLPECLTYSRETSIGLKRVWTYTVELT